VITNPTRTTTTLTLTFNTPGNYPVTVISAGTSAVCNVVVTATEAPDPGPLIEAPAPGLPNTGELPV
jgi:hypothetical protein